MNLISKLSNLISRASAIALVTAVASIASAQQPSSTNQDVDENAPGSDVESADSQVLEEIIVTGTYIRGVAPVGSNLVGITRKDIEVIGASSTPELLASIPQLNSFNTAPRASGGGFNLFAPALRSLPATATLTLMNGHRLVGGSVQNTNPDYPLLPDLAIERVEIIADGASAVYGSDAIAGVVNFIAREDVEGAEASVRYGAADEYYQFSASGLFGHNWGTGSFLAAYQYMENDNISGGERDYRVLDFRPWGGVDTRAINCPLANVRMPSTGNTNYADPALIPNTTNYCDGGAPVDLFPESRLHSVYVTAKQELSDNVTMWGDLLYSDRLDHIRVAAPAQTVYLLYTNPFFKRPTGNSDYWETVLFRMDNIFGSDFLEQTDNAKVGNSSAGFDIELNGGLNLSIYGTYGWTNNDAFQPGVDSVALTAAAAGTTLDTALDPFGQGTSPAVIANIIDNPTDVTIDQRTYLGAARIDGPLADLPGGELKFAAGTEYRRETFAQRGYVGVTPVPENLDRNIYSVFGEVYVPIFGAGNEATLLKGLALSLSARYDHYSDFGDTTNPKVGLIWNPVEDVTVRGTLGTSFRAPGMREIGATVGSVYLPAAWAAVLAFDPTRGLNQVNTIYLIGGNAELQPEEADTQSFGIDWQPSFLPNFSASVTFYDINFDGAISTPSASLLFSDPNLESYIIRDPTADEVDAFLTESEAVPINLPVPLPPIGNLLDQRLGNFGIRDTNGLDYSFNYNWDTDFGAVFAGLAGTYILEFNTKLSPASDTTDSLRLGVPESAFRATLGFIAGSVNVTSFVNYRSGITNTYNTPTGLGVYEASSYVTVDLRAAWTLPFGGYAEGTELVLQVNDLFDEEPPFFPGNDGIGGPYNPIGRFIALNLRKTW